MHVAKLDCLFVAANCVEDKMLIRQIELMRVRRCVMQTSRVAMTSWWQYIVTTVNLLPHCGDCGKPRHQNQGIGGRLLQAAEDWGRRQGAECASLEYHAANKRASVFYQQHMGYSVASITAIQLSSFQPCGQCSKARHSWLYSHTGP